MQQDLPVESIGPMAPAMARAIRACVHCGFCLAACPTYRELGEEMDSPRGRIVLMKEVLEGRLDVGEAQPYLDRCLGCLACEPACPSGVEYRHLISPFRAVTEREAPVSAIARLRRLGVLRLLAEPRLFRLLLPLARLGRPLAGLLPSSVRPMLALAPSSVPAPDPVWGTHAAIGTRRARVALLAGCAQQVLAPRINRATIEVLTRQGVEVVVPAGQGCCGSLAWHVGDLGMARELAARNVAAFPGDVDAVVTNAAGCGSGMREYGLMFAGTDLETAAAELAARAVDAAAFLARLGPVESASPSKAAGGRRLRVAYHDACHLAHGQGVRREPRDLLRAIAGAEVLEIRDPHLCCGSAGTYNLDQPEIAGALGRAKAEGILETRPDVVATGNVGCLVQLRAHLARFGWDAIPVRHTMEVLAEAGSLSGR